MVQAKVILTAASVLLLSSCCGPRMKWEAHDMDGHRTGVYWTTALNVEEAMGSVSDGVYTAPNGRVFSEGATPVMAAHLLAAQPAMHDLKLPVGTAAHDLVRHAPECELTNYIVDMMMKRTEQEVGERVDVGILNFGGIRCDIPAGEILRDDIESMLPFNNRYSYVRLLGEDLLHIFEFIASTRPQIIGGARIAVKDGKIAELTVGGQPVDPAREYGVATLDFLLDGGDGLYVARNARKLVITDILPKRVIREQVEDLAAEGKPLEYHEDGRFVILP